jgi:3-dehydroquinate synthase class II
MTIACHALNYLTTLQAYLDKRREVNTAVKLVEAVVTRVEAVGMGDRVCVDLCNLLRPGEGLLVC